MINDIVCQKYISYDFKNLKYKVENLVYLYDFEKSRFRGNWFKLIAIRAENNFATDINESYSTDKCQKRRKMYIYIYTTRKVHFFRNTGFREFSK